MTETVAVSAGGPAECKSEGGSHQTGVGWRVICALVLIVCSASTAASAPKTLETATCKAFFERIAQADAIFGDMVPAFKFDVDPKDLPANPKITYSIGNARGLTGFVTCIKATDQMVVFQVDTSIDRDPVAEDVKVAARFLSTVSAATWAYTAWPKPKVQKVTSDLLKRGFAAAKKADLRGDDNPQGEASFEVSKTVDLRFWAGGGLTFMIDVSPDEGGS